MYPFLLLKDTVITKRWYENIMANDRSSVLLKRRSLHLFFPKGLVIFCTLVHVIRLIDYSIIESWIRLYATECAIWFNHKCRKAVPLPVFCLHRDRVSEQVPLVHRSQGTSLPETRSRVSRSGIRKKRKIRVNVNTGKPKCNWYYSMCSSLDYCTK